MTLKLNLSVSSEDIARGRRGSTESCPIANGLKRLFPDAFDVHVSYSADCQCVGDPQWYARVQSFKGSLMFNLSKEASRKAQNFDKTGVMEPFVEEMSII